MSAHQISTERLRLAYGDRVVVDDLTTQIPSGRITTIIGPNGCGKSTFLRAIARLLKPKAGEVLLDGKAITSLRTREVAKVLGMLPQSPTAPEGLTVADLVAKGRHPHQSWLRQWSRDDEAEVDAALRLTGMQALAARPVDELSGGQRQRAWISMALAQETDVLLLDEPTTYLDLAHQVEVLDLVDKLHADLGRTVVMVLHDLNLAARYSDHLIVMRAGAVVTSGPPDEVVNAALLREVFGLESQVLVDPVSQRPLIVPVGARRVASGVA